MLLILHRMGGPRAWKAMQEQQQEFRAGFDAPESVAKNSDDDENKPDMEKRDLYAEYDIDPETENEKSQRGVKDMGDEPGQEDVSDGLSRFEIIFIDRDRNSRWL